MHYNLMRDLNSPLSGYVTCSVGHESKELTNRLLTLLLWFDVINYQHL